MQGLQQGRDTDIEGIDEEGKSEKEEIIIEDSRFSARLFDNALRIILRIDIHEQPMYFIFVDEHEQNEEQAGPHTQLDRLKSKSPIYLILVFLNKIAYFG
jgi:hypothetical protein